jgi:hypothetical protein
MIFTVRGMDASMLMWPWSLFSWELNVCLRGNSVFVYHHTLFYLFMCPVCVNLCLMLPDRCPALVSLPSSAFQVTYLPILTSSYYQLQLSCTVCCISGQPLCFVRNLLWNLSFSYHLLSKPHTSTSCIIPDSFDTRFVFYEVSAFISVLLSELAMAGCYC